MNWEAVGTIAEIVGATGVIASLLYLAVQIRQSTKVSRAETTKDLYLASRDAILQIASNDELAKIWTDIRNFESIDNGFVSSYVTSGIGRPGSTATWSLAGTTRR